MKDSIMETGNRKQETGNRVCFTPFHDQNAYISLMREAINLTDYELFKDESRAGSHF